MEDDPTGFELILQGTVHKYMAKIAPKFGRTHDMKADRHVLTKHHEKGFGVLSTLTSGWLQCISTT